jgi:hypothetical protein
MTAAQLPRDPLQTPTARLQPQHLRHVVWHLHHLPPWIIPRRAFRDSFVVHSLSHQLSKEGAIPRGDEGAIFHGVRQAGLRSFKADFAGDVMSWEARKYKLYQLDKE